MIQQEIVEKQAQNLVEMSTGCDTMFKHKKLDELALMYKNFNRVPSTLKYVIDKMSPYIIERGKLIVTDQALLKDPINFTLKLLEFKQEMDDLVDVSFQNNSLF